MSNVVRLHASSGTTGRATVVGYTKRDIDTWSELMARCFVAAGLTKNDIIHNAYGYGLFTGRPGRPLRGREAGRQRHPHVRRQHQAADHDPAGFRPDGDLLHALLCPEPRRAGEGDGGRHEGAQAPGRDLRRRTLERKDAAGDRETHWTSRRSTSTDCPRSWARASPWNASEGRNGMHIFEDHFLVEVIDPETGEVLPPGETGGAGLHHAHEGGLPAHPLPDAGTSPACMPEPCRCGRTLVRMDRITGRSDDMLIIRGVNVFPSQIEAVLVGIEGLEPHYQIIVDRAGQPRHAGDPGGGQRTALRQRRRGEGPPEHWSGASSRISRIIWGSPPR